MFDDRKVSYELMVEPDQTPVRGNSCVTGNDAIDTEVEDSIIARLDDGNIWAWAMVRCTARYEGIDSLSGVDYLGCCSYTDEDEFKQPGGYWDEMKDTARDDLYYQMDDVANSGGNDEA